MKGVSMKPNKEIMAQAKQHIEHYQEVVSDVLGTVEAEFGEDAASLLVVYTAVLNRQLQFLSLLQAMNAPSLESLVEEMEQDAKALTSVLAFVSLLRIPKKGDPEDEHTLRHLELTKFYRVVTDKMIGLEKDLRTIKGGSNDQS
jgi:hypothetical protein